MDPNKLKQKLGSSESINSQLPDKDVHIDIKSLEKKISELNLTTSVDIDSLAQAIIKKLPTTFQYNSHSSQSESCSENSKTVCVNTLKNKIEREFLKYQEIAEIYQEFENVEIILDKLNDLLGIKINKKNRIQASEETEDNPLQKQILENEKNDVVDELKSLNKLLKRTPLFSSSHQAVESSLKNLINTLKLESNELAEYKSICSEQTCFEESELIKSVCGALEYGKFLSDDTD